jgi:hypothetical protein
MSTELRSGNPSAQVIRSLLQHQSALWVYAKAMPYTLPAEVVALAPDTGQLVLEAEYAGQDIEQYLTGSRLHIDIEALKGPDAAERATASAIYPPGS